MDDLDHEQYAHFGSKVISVTEREGLHTLDAIVLADDAPEIHTADTHGATELVFAGFDLLGRRSSRASTTSPTCRSTASGPANPDSRPTHCSRAESATS